MGKTFEEPVTSLISNISKPRTQRLRGAATKENQEQYCSYRTRNKLKPLLIMYYKVEGPRLKRNIKQS